MSDQFDKKLVEKINEVFDSYQDGSADKGWEDLRARYPEKANNRRALWWFSSAAALLLLAGIWFYSGDKNLEDQNSVAKKIGRDTTQNQSAESLKSTGEPVIAITDTGSVEKPISKNGDVLPENRLAGGAAGMQEVVFFATKRPKSYSRKARSKVTEESNSAVDATSNMSASMHDLTIVALSSTSSQPQSTTASNSENDVVTDDSVSVKQTPAATTPEIDTRQQLSTLIQAEKNKKANKKTDKRTTFSVFAGQYFTYATGSETKSNNGFGFSSEIKINKSLRLTTGASLGQNSLNFEKTVPTTAYMSYAERNNLSNAIAAPSFNSGLDSRYSINSFNAKLTGLDIPVNLKYYFNEPNQKQNIFYLSTGLSSNLFIKETYTYNVTQASGNSNLNLPSQRTTSSFESFDFARTLNIALGIGRALSPRTNLTVEPFLKYPLSGLGTENLKFGSAGINLKMQFEKKK